VAETNGHVAQANGQAAPQWNRLYYDEWVAREGLDLIRGYKVDDVYTVPLKPWARTGGNAVQIQLEGTGELNASYVQEIPPGRQLAPQHHIYEEMVFVLSGRGSTSIWLDGKPKNSFEWGPGSLFSIPLNAWYQHFNGSGTEPARYLAMNMAPITLNLLRNEDVVFNSDFQFTERYGGEQDYFSGEIDIVPFGGWGFDYKVAHSNFFADVQAIPDELFTHGIRGQGTKGITFVLANGVLGSHILEFPGGVFSKLHRHGPGAHVLWLKGDGYSLLWPDGGERRHESWGPGTMLVPPSWWWHMHAVTSREPAVHLALRVGNTRHRINRLSDGVLQSTKAGGSQMDYEDVPPALMEDLIREFQEECAKRGTPVRLEAVTGL
jgi:mannose-6-phosphate isomerase-like protein (cupin superfamily)